MRKRVGKLSIFLALLFAASLLHAQSQETTKPPEGTMEHGSMKSKTLSMEDKHFVSEAAIGGLAEVQLGKIAAKAGQSQDVKDFANRMVTDHGKANTELKTMAKAKHIVLPTKLDSKHATVVQKLSSTSPTDFDKEYMKEMVKDHAKTVAKFREASNDLQDSDLKSWASKTLPTLEEHLTLAKTTAEKVGVDVNAAAQEGEQEASSKMKEEKKNQ